MKRFSAFLAFATLAACGQGEGPSEPGAGAAADASAAAEAAAGSYSYEVRLVFDPAAAQDLAARGERVTISSDYFGVAKRGGGKPEANGQVTLAQSELQVEPVDQLVRIVSPVIQSTALKNVEGEPMLLVNVHSARQTSQDNLINCGLYDGSLAVATVRPILIECGLIRAGGGAIVAADAP